MAGCRDCARCTETGFTTLIKLVPRIIALTWRIPLGFFRKKCPQCGHLMSKHRMIDGKFAD